MIMRKRWKEYCNLENLFSALVNFFNGRKYTDLTI